MNPLQIWHNYEFGHVGYTGFPGIKSLKTQNSTFDPVLLAIILTLIDIVKLKFAMFSLEI